MSRGFHAFFRQYYNLRNLLRRIDDELGFLIPIEDYPLQRPDGLRDSFAGLARTPPWSLLQFMLRSPAFTPRGLARIDVSAASELLRVRFPETYAAYDGESAAAFLDRLRFPHGARDLALEVFARSFFADPNDFGAGELIAMFHTYFLGSAEGLLFDVPHDDYDTVLWAPLANRLRGLGVELATGTPVKSLDAAHDGMNVDIDGQIVRCDATVLAADPRSARELVAGLQGDGGGLASWQQAVAATRNAPPFVVVRLWLDTPVHHTRPAFLGTSGYGSLDNVSVLDRFEAGASRWAKDRGGSVIELHAYACDSSVTTDPDAAAAVVTQLEAQLHRLYPETVSAATVAQDVLVRDDCTLIGPGPWGERPSIRTPFPGLVLAGDWVRCEFPVALMERAATTGFLAANALLARWGVSGEGVWTVPMRGLLARR